MLNNKMEELFFKSWI